MGSSKFDRVERGSAYLSNRHPQLQDPRLEMPTNDISVLAKIFQKFDLFTVSESVDQAFWH